MSDPIYARIRAAAVRGTLFHAMLFTGRGDRFAAACYAAAAMQCTAWAEAKPCGACPACRKVRAGIHPDVTVVVDPEHTNISVEIIRALRKDMFILPNEGARKVCIFPDCKLLTTKDQDVLLKLVEEGPAYAAFLFCAENAEELRPTVRSRCVEWKLRPSEEREDVPESWEDLYQAIITHQPGEIALVAARLEKTGKDAITREALGALLERCREAFAQALVGRCRESGVLPETRRLTVRQLMGLVELLEKYRRDCGYNVNPGQVLGGLAAELEGFF